MFFKQTIILLLLQGNSISIIAMAFARATHALDKGDLQKVVDIHDELKGSSIGVVQEREKIHKLLQIKGMAMLMLLKQLWLQ